MEIFCKLCGDLIIKRKTDSDRNYERRQYCNQRCRNISNNISRASKPSKSKYTKYVDWSQREIDMFQLKLENRIKSDWYKREGVKYGTY